MAYTNLFAPVLILFLFCSCTKDKMTFDILIENGTVYNGIDSIPAKIAIGIRKDKISFVGSLNGQRYKALRVIDAKGMIVGPGFIDPHTHADMDLTQTQTSHNLPFLMQGVTTVAVGNDGHSLFPITKYSSIYDSVGLGTNVVMFTGHGTLRKQVMGDSDRPPTPSELGEMHTLLQKEMNDGAIGLSTGLFYKPGSYSQTDEIISLAKLVAENKGIYDTHLRDEGTFSVGLVPAIQEAIEIGKKARLPIHISHIKCLGVDVWQQSNDIIELIENARSNGVDVTANQYPYKASATSLQAAVVPRWAESGGKDSLYIRYDSMLLKNRILTDTRKNIVRRGGPDKLLIVRAEDSTLIGKTLQQIAKGLNLSSESTVLEILRQNSIKVASFNMTLSDITNFMRQDWVVTGSDGGSGHPRKYGSFPRKYHKYVVTDSIIPLHRFIGNSSSETARILQLPKRGVLKEGFYADVIIFNPKTFRDNADYTNAYAYSSGLTFAIINGKLSIEGGKYIDKKNGKVLRHELP